MRIAQIRYGINMNPANITSDDLLTGDVFGSNKYKNISQLGIQGFPGTSFFLNKGYAITLGETGIYEIDLNGRGFIDTIHFVNNTAFEKYVNKQGTLLIDIVCEG